MTLNNRKLDPVAEAFEDARTEIIQDLMDHPDHSDIAISNEWLKSVLDYNLKSGKYFRGLAIVHVSRHFCTDFSPELLRKTCILGWSLEMLHASFLMADDMMDGSTLRRGQPCWYKVSQIGNKAINDVYIVESALFYVLGKHFRGQDYYVKILDLYHDAVLKTTLGQTLDLQTVGNSHVQLKDFTMERYCVVVKYKTSHYSFCLPFLLAFAVCGINDESYIQNVKKILFQVGYIFQIKDDILDCYGNPDVTGKNATDITEGKCTWLIARAMEKCSEEQLRILEKNNGNVPGEVKERARAVKEIYEELGLLEESEKEEMASREKIRQLLSQLPDQKYHTKFYSDFLLSIYDRKK